MDMKQVAAAIAPTPTPTYGDNVNAGGGNQQMLQNIQNVGALDATGDFSRAAMSAIGGAAGQDVASQEAARRAAIEKAAMEAKAKEDEEKRKNDPNNYKAIINDVGGYDFYDPDGNKISAVDYARKKNVQITDVYKDSQDPNDKDFIEDYERVTELGKIIQSGSKEERDKFYEKNPDFKDAYHDWTYSDIVKDLHVNYPGYFRSNKQGVQDLGKAEKIGVPEQDPRNALSRFKDTVIPSFLGNTKSQSRWWD